MFSREQVAKVASLARLHLTEEETGRMSHDLGAILEYVDQLNEVDTSGIEPLAHCLPIQNIFREDEVRPSLPVDEALANAPKRSGDFYSVPPILD
ncbi:MAG: Asp-tRNA(Asn)/Glu-tRNA(Gln) amidotransferase subunit GatC [Planctomycetota bacterium]